MVHASSSFLTNIIKICLRVSKLWSTQDFGLRGGKYIIKKVRVVSLACDMPTGPPLHFYKTLSKYVLGYQSYGSHHFTGYGEMQFNHFPTLSLWELSVAMATKPRGRSS